MNATAEASTAPADAAAAARTLGSPAVAGSPEHPGDIPTVEQVDWTGLIIAALGPGTSIDLPLPQLLLRLTETVATLAANAEHLKGFVAGTGQDQEDLAGSVDTRIKAANRKRSELATTVEAQALTIERLSSRVEHLEAALTAPDDASTVNSLNLSSSQTTTR